jgi:hypothetical protein
MLLTVPSAPKFQFFTRVKPVPNTSGRVGPGALRRIVDVTGSDGLRPGRRRARRRHGCRRCRLAATPAGQRPPLVAAAVAVVELNGRARRRRRALDVQAPAGLRAADGAVGAHRPLLVAAAVAGVDRDDGSVAGLLALGVQAFAVDRDLSAVGGRPALAGAVLDRGTAEIARRWGQALTGVGAPDEHVRPGRRRRVWCQGDRGGAEPEHGHRTEAHHGGPAGPDALPESAHSLFLPAWVGCDRDRSVNRFIQHRS